MDSEGNECKSPSPDFLPMKKTWETLRGENWERTMPALLLACQKTSFPTLSEGSSSGKTRSVNEYTL